jgi:hypothetical protein
MTSDFSHSPEREFASGDEIAYKIVILDNAESAQ